MQHNNDYERNLAALKIIGEVVENEQQRLTALEKRLLDFEAARFTDEIERAMDLEKWNGIHAALVGQELEEIADRLMAVIGANRRGEDIDVALADIHVEVCCLMADISTGTDKVTDCAVNLDATTERIADMLGISVAAVEELATARLIPCDRLGHGDEAYWAYDSRAIAEMFGIG